MQAAPGAAQARSTRSNSTNKRHSQHEKSRRSLAFLRRGADVDDDDDDDRPNGMSPTTKFTRKLNNLGLYENSPSTPAAGVTSETVATTAAHFVPGGRGRSREHGLRNRLSFRRQSNATTDDAPSVSGATGRSHSQSRSGAESAVVERKASQVSSERGSSAVGAARTESASGKSGGERSLSREGRGGSVSTESGGAKKRFSMLGLVRKASKGNVSGGSRVQEAVPEE